MSRLKISFELVKKQFFPRWDRKNEWTISKGEPPAPGAQGYCERATKTITIRDLPHDQNNLYFLLIHEVCHVLSTDSHGWRWKDRMLMASRMAKKKGNVQLSRMILFDLKKLRRFGETKGASRHSLDCRGFLFSDERR